MPFFLSSLSPPFIGCRLLQCLQAMALQDTFPHARTFSSECLSSFASTAGALLAIVLLVRNSAFRHRALWGLQPLRPGARRRRPVTREDERLRDRTIRKDSLLSAKEGRRAGAVKQVTNVLLEVDGRSAALATRLGGGYSNGNRTVELYWRSFRIINVEALQVWRGHRLAGSVFVLLLAF